MTPYQKHRKRWNDCDKCSLCGQRSRVVLARGKVPAPVLFCGEAPGASEDILGRPFVGPAGKLLDRIIAMGLDGQHDYCLTNLVACIPREEGGEKGEPSKSAIEACTDRLVEMVELCRPRVVICVGALAAKWCGSPKRVGILFSRKKKPELVSIVHPAAILRMGVAQQGLAIQRCVVALEDAVEGL